MKKNLLNPFCLVITALTGFLQLNFSSVSAQSNIIIGAGSQM
jgi:hypothetical protein